MSYRIDIDDGVAHFQLARPNSGNALNADIWNDLPGRVSELDRTGEVRAMIVSSEGDIFCAGMDLSEFASGIPDPDTPAAREAFYHLAVSLQESFTCLERTRFPVIAVVQGACLGAGLELVAACDLRFVTSDAYFRLEEINTGIMADVGALQRLPKQIPDALMKEIAFLGRPLKAEEAARFGFVNRVCDSHSAALEAAREAAKTIASKAPVAIAGTKAALRWTRDHSVADALEWSARAQSAFWSTADIKAAIGARRTRSDATFEPLKPKKSLGADD